MNERQYRQIRIPMWLIAILFFINIPLAIILLIVRSIKIKRRQRRDPPR